MRVQRPPALWPLFTQRPRSGLCPEVLGDARTVASSERVGRDAPKRVRTDTDLASCRVILQVLHQPVSENIQGTPGLLGESQRVQKERLWRGAGPWARSHAEAGSCR